MANLIRTSWRTRNVWGFAWASLFSDLGHEMVTAMLPGFLLSIGAPAVALGLIEGISNLAQSLASVWGGSQADRNPRRGQILVWGYVLTALKVLIAAVTFWPWIIVLRTMAWIGRGARGPVRNTYIAEEVFPTDRGKAFGFREMFDTFGAVMGPLIATLWLAHSSYRALIMWSAVPAVVTIIVIVKFVHDPSPRVHVSKSHRGPREPAAWPQVFRRLRWATVIFSAGYLAPTFFILRVITSHTQFMNLSPGVLGLALYTIHNIAYAVGSYPAGWWSDRRGGKVVLVSGYLLWTIVLVGFFVNHHNVAFWVALFVGSGLATALIETGQKSWSVHILPVSRRGSGLGQIAGLTGLGQLVASGFAGIVWTMGSPTNAFGIAAVLAAVGSALMVFSPIGN